MNGRSVKLLKEFCKRYNKPYKAYRDNFKILNSFDKANVLESIKKSLPVVN
jgi:hypothetical protein